jgi:molybdopterin-containing oxidoreductase family iron-sulfur binding subunit
MPYGFLIDLEKCVGCHACSVACKSANGTPPSVTRSIVKRTTEGTFPDVKRVITPMLCMLCEEPSCVAVCPVEATYKNDEGIVVIDKELCIGCKLCMTACPYEARYYIEGVEGYYGSELSPYEAVAYVNMKEKTVDKCDFCIGRSADGKTPDPACVKACITKARLFGDYEEIKALSDERSGYQLLPDQGTNPRVFYLSDIIN